MNRKAYKWALRDRRMAGVVAFYSGLELYIGGADVSYLASTGSGWHPVSSSAMSFLVFGTPWYAGLNQIWRSPILCAETPTVSVQSQRVIRMKKPMKLKALVALTPEQREAFDMLLRHTPLRHKSVSQILHTVAAMDAEAAPLESQSIHNTPTQTSSTAVQVVNTALRKNPRMTIGNMMINVKWETTMPRVKGKLADRARRPISQTPTAQRAIVRKRRAVNMRALS